MNKYCASLSLSINILKCVVKVLNYIFIEVIYRDLHVIERLREIYSVMYIYKGK